MENTIENSTETLPDSVEVKWDEIMDEIRQIHGPRHGAANGEKYLKYVVETYFEGMFPITFWNHYDTQSSLTNNAQ